MASQEALSIEVDKAKIRRVMHLYGTKTEKETIKNLKTRVFLSLSNTCDTSTASAIQYPIDGRYKNLSAINILMGIMFNAGPRVIKNKKTEKDTWRSFFANLAAPAIIRIIAAMERKVAGSAIDRVTGNLR